MKKLVFWIILSAILILIAVLSFTNCFSDSISVNYSELDHIESVLVEKDITGNYKNQNSFTKEQLKGRSPIIASTLTKDGYTAKIMSVVVDKYNVNFTISIRNADKLIAVRSFTTIFGRTADQIAKLEEAFGRADVGVSFTYTDPNAGSIWSSLLPLAGTIIVAVVFFILIMNSQGGAKGAMNFAKTNARLNHNIKVRFTDVAGAEEEKAELAEVVDFLKNPAKILSSRQYVIYNLFQAYRSPKEKQIFLTFIIIYRYL